MMKKNILSTLFAGFAVLLAACTSDLSDNPISTTVPGNSILQLEITQSEETRGVITSKTFQEGDSVLVVIADKDKGVDLTEMRKATYIGGKWVLDTELDFSKPISGLTWSDNTNVEVYYPYDIVNYPYDKSKGYFELDNLLSQTDILVGYVKEVNSKNPVAKVTCQHAMTRLTFVLMNNSDQPAKIDSFFIEPGKQPFFGTTGFLSSSGLFNIGYEYTISEECNIEIAGGESYNMDLLLAPTSEAYKRMNDEGYNSDTWAVVLTINGSQSFFQIPVASWDAGQQYTYPVTLPAPKSPGKPVESVTIYGNNSEGQLIKEDLMVVIQNLTTQEWSGPYTATYDESKNNYDIKDFSFSLEEDTWYAAYAVSGLTRWDSPGYVVFSQDDYNMGYMQTPIYWGIAEIGWSQPYLKMELSEWTSRITVSYPASWGKIEEVTMNDEDNALPGNAFYIQNKQNLGTGNYYRGVSESGCILSNDGSKYEYSFNIFPVKLSSEYCSITLPLESGDRKFACPDLNMESGHQYQIDINSEGLEVSDVTVKTWEDNNGGNINITPKF